MFFSQELRSPGRELSSEKSQFFARLPNEVFAGAGSRTHDSFVMRESVFLVDALVLAAAAPLAIFVLFGRHSVMQGSLNKSCRYSKSESSLF